MTASFYEPQHWRGELFRISRGYPRGQRKAWQDLPFLAPSPTLYRAYKRGELGAQEYARSYRRELAERREEVSRWLESLPGDGDLTLLCFERQGEFCHRQLVAELVREGRPDIPVLVR